MGHSVNKKPNTLVNLIQGTYLTSTRRICLRIWEIFLDRRTAYYGCLSQQEQRKFFYESINYS